MEPHNERSFQDFTPERTPPVRGLSVEEVTRVPSPDRFSNLDIDTSTEAKRARGERMLGLLNRRKTGLIERILSRPTTNAESILMGIEGGSKETVNVEHAWMDDVVTDILDGNPTRVITGNFTAVTEKEPDADGIRTPVIPTHVNGEDQTTLQVTGLFNEVAREIAPNVLPIVILREQRDPHLDADFTQEARDGYVLDRTEKLREAGIVDEDTVFGDDIHIIQESSQQVAVHKLVAELEATNTGEILKGQYGSVCFLPDADTVDIAALHDITTSERIKRNGIYLKYRREGFVPDAVLSAVLLDSMNAPEDLPGGDNPVTIVSIQSLAADDEAYVLLRAAHGTKQEFYHSVAFENPKFSRLNYADGGEDSIYSYSDIRELELITHLERETKKYMDSLDAYTDWNEFDPYRYNIKNYGEMLPEDEELIEQWITNVKRLGIHVETSANIGAGPSWIGPMLLEPFSDRIKILEYSEANLGYIEHNLRNDFPEEHEIHGVIWDKYEEHMVVKGGDIYRGVVERTKEKVTAEKGDIRDLPKDEWPVVTHEFVAESRVRTQRPFRETIQSTVDAGTDDVVIVSMHMLKSQGYSAGEGTNFPAVSLTPQDLVEAYRDAGMADVKVFVTGETDQIAREGYHGMAMIIARDRRQKNFALAAN